jgi:hypothetical protein
MPTTLPFSIYTMKESAARHTFFGLAALIVLRLIADGPSLHLVEIIGEVVALVLIGMFYLAPSKVEVFYLAHNVLCSGYLAWNLYLVIGKLTYFRPENVASLSRPDDPWRTRGPIGNERGSETMDLIRIDPNGSCERFYPQAL